MRRLAICTSVVLWVVLLGAVQAQVAGPKTKLSVVTDRPDARPDEALINTQLMLMEMGASEEQVASPVVYASGRDGWAGLAYDAMESTLSPLFEAILAHIPCPAGDDGAPLRMQVSTIDYNDYLGRLGIGRIHRGTIRLGGPLKVNRRDGSLEDARVTKIYTFEGLKRVEVEEAGAGEIIALAGMEDVDIGETIASADDPTPLPFVAIEEPTLSMNFMVNNSPFAGLDGKYVTTRHLSERLSRELRSNVSLLIELTDTPDVFRVSGRGELHLSILIETMRREGYEFLVSRPRVITREDAEGERLEPYEELMVDVPEHQVEEIHTLLTRVHPEARDEGVEPNIPAFP